MKLKLFSIMFLLLFICSEIYSQDSRGFNEKRMSVCGNVSTPLNLSADDLRSFFNLTVSKKVIDKRGKPMKKEFNGVPLRSLLGFAGIPVKRRGGAAKGDYIVILKSRTGKRIFLSWTEIFSKDKSEILIVTDKSGERSSEIIKEISYPFLFFKEDKNFDRSIFDIDSIEVRELFYKIREDSCDEKISSSLKIRDKDGGFHYIKSLKGSVEHDVSLLRKRSDCSRIPLVLLLKKNGLNFESHDILMIKFTDGSVRAVSYGELFFDTEKRLLIAEEEDNVGGFVLMSSDSDRSKVTGHGLKEIEIRRIESKAKFFIIGIGCADSSLITLDAISFMAKCDVFICSDDIRKRFSYYMGGKPVLFDPFINIAGFQKKMNPELSFNECSKKVIRIRKKNIERIKKIIASGKSIGFLEYGDPTLYPHWTSWLAGHIPKKNIVIRPGISALNAANSMIGGNIAGSGSLVATVPGALFENEFLLKAAAKNGDTLAIFTGIRDLKMLRTLFLKYYNRESPVLLVYRAGYKSNEKMVKTTVGKVVDAALHEKEKWLGMIYIGGACEKQK